jgi:hypothetical protein
MNEVADREYVNNYGVSVRAYQTRLGGVYHSEAVALSVAGETEPVHALVRFSDIAEDFVDGQKVPAIRDAIRAYYKAVEEGENPQVQRDVVFLTIEEVLGMSPRKEKQMRALEEMAEDAQALGLGY